MEATLSEATILRSVKKYFIDTFDTLEGVPVFFDYIERQPMENGLKVDKWACILPRSLNAGTLSKMNYQVHLFIAKDKDGMELASFRDFVTDKLQDLSQTDGRLRLPFYDSLWALQFYGVLQLQDDLNTIVLEEGIKTKIIPFTLYWGAK